MKSYSKSWSVQLPINLEQAWSFFSDPHNLKYLTPASMNFKIISKLPADEIYEGMIIRYQVTPLFNIPLNWTTEITHCKKHHYFIDDQRTGPYAMWHHEHHFFQNDSGIEMRDILTYALHFGYVGRVVNEIYISNKIDSIFAFREKVLKNKFPC